MKKKTLALQIIVAFFLLSITSFLWLISPMKRSDKDVLLNSNYYIAHATGSVEGHTYLNCREGVEHSLANGYKYIELDLGLTTDSILVCLHDWAFFHKKTISDTIDTDSPILLSEFKTRKLLQRYTPLTVADVLLIRESHPFIIVTDKISDADILNKVFKNNREGVMVEAFSIYDFKELKSEGYTPMMSLGKFELSTIFWWFIYYPIKYHVKIDWICVHTSSNMKSLRILKRLFHCKVAMFSSNSPAFFNEHLGKEIDLIYTDNWNPQLGTNYSD